MEIAIAADVQAQERPELTRTGSTPRQWLLSDEAEDGFSFRVIRSTYQSGGKAFETPRHHHGFQQIRWSESGSLNFAPGRDIEAGDIAYFPRGTYYGPQRRDHGVGLTIQFGFGIEMLGGKDAVSVHSEGIARLKERGRVESGIFIDVDPGTGQERRRDAAEVIAQDQTGTTFTIPAEGYATPILMHPRAFDFYAAAHGVEVKHLGGFYDHPGPSADVRIMIVRLSSDGVYRLGTDRAQLVWSTTAGLRVDGSTYPELTCVYSPRAEGATLSTEDGVELFVVEFPRLD
jgi:hypothetical protein